MLQANEQPRKIRTEQDIEIEASVYGTGKSVKRFLTKTTIITIPNGNKHNLDENPFSSFRCCCSVQNKKRFHFSEAYPNDFLTRQIILKHVHSAAI